MSSGAERNRELLEQYITDEELIGHILFFEKVFPDYDVVAEEITAEDNRVVMRGRMKGVHRGDFNGISPTYRAIDVPCVVTYYIENNKITHFWSIADQALMMEQLSVMNAIA
jgi:predicted ester cyclase